MTRPLSLYVYKIISLFFDLLIINVMNKLVCVVEYWRGNSYLAELQRMGKSWRLYGAYVLRKGLGHCPQYNRQGRQCIFYRFREEFFPVKVLSTVVYYIGIEKSELFSVHITIQL
jgi:hypothetical protein